MKPNLDASSTFFFIGLFQNVSVHPKYETQTKAAGFSTLDFLITRVVQYGS